jgi:hypothetical protein
MENIDDEWESFLQNDGDDFTPDTKSINENINSEKNVSNLQSNDVNSIPKCSPIYISTKTKISYLNTNEIDIKKVFWDIPILDYSSPNNGIIKKQIKYSSICKEDVDMISNNLEGVKYYEEQIIEHIENPDGRIKYKDQRKISIGICKKDILSYRSKKKRAFFNCFVMIMRIFHNDEYKEMHIKVFNTGKLEIPGIQTELLLDKVLTLLVKVLRPYIGEDLNYIKDKSETVLINSNFNCGYFIDRDKLYDLLKYKYRINSNFDACSYPGIQCKFYYDNTITDQTGQQPNHKDCQEVSFMVFRTGSVLVVGKCEEDVLHEIYRIIKTILESEYRNISCVNENNTAQTNKQRKTKIRKKTILMN